MKKQSRLRINLNPDLQKEITRLELKIKDLEEVIWDHRRNERCYKDALFSLLSVTNNKQMRSGELLARKS